MHGTVKWFNNSKGYGFIGRDAGPGVFVHYSAIVGDGFRHPQACKQVELDVVTAKNGRQSANESKDIA